MTSLLFALAVVALFALVFSIEISVDKKQPRLGQYGLFTWLVSGNWPAKVGAGLLIMGIGALLRYAMINIDVPPEAKLSSGILVAAILAAAAFALRNRPQRRAIHLALSGAAFGVAYLTAYAAYDLFGFLSGINAFALLALVAAVAGVFAVSSNAMSVAVLAMVGAYLAPAFGLKELGPLPVYGYYVAVSAVSLVMISMRGWRALIHLSFLFTLAGAIFFAWTARYYQPEYHSIMQPMLLALAALHLAMPLVERRHIPSTWSSRFDLGYFICLPIVASVLMLLIAPSWLHEGSVGLAMLALIWIAAAGILKALGQSREALRHTVVAVLLAIGVVLCRFDDIPWELIGIGFFIGAMTLAPRLGWTRTAEEVAAGGALLFTFLHVIDTFSGTAVGAPFQNQVFLERLLAAAMLGYGAWVGRRRGLSMAMLLATAAIGWLTLAVLAELLRLHLDFIPQLGYCIVLAALVFIGILSRKNPPSPILSGFLMFALFCSGWWAAHTASATFGIAAFVMTPLALLTLAWCNSKPASDHGDDFTAVLALNMLPLALLPWAIQSADAAGWSSDFFPASAVVIGAFCATFAAHAWLAQSPRWRAAQAVHFYAVAGALVFVTLFKIEREVWAVAFDLLALSYLAMVIGIQLRAGQIRNAQAGTVAVIAATLVVQAMLLRAFGPDGSMTIADLGKMRLRAVVSLVWVVMGAGLTWWGVKAASRQVWTIGAVLLVVGAAKLVLFDFGSLGQLGNILAVIAAGLLFLGVAWLAPMPPKEPDDIPAAPSDASGNALSSAAMQSIPRNKYGPDPRALSQASTQPATQAQPEGTAWPWVLFILLALAIWPLASAWRNNTMRMEERERISRERAQGQARFQGREMAPPPAAAPAPVAQPESAPVAQPAPAPALSSSPLNLGAPAPIEKQATDPTAPAAAGPVNVADACSRFTEQLPSDVVLHVAGNYKGARLNFQIDQSGHEATVFDVYVNEPGKNVVLVLGAYEPSVWNVQRSAGTKIVGVMLSGYHRQALAGVASSVPVLQSSYSMGAPCGYFYMTRENAIKADQVVRRVFGRSASSYYIANDGRIDLGEPATSASAFSQSSETTVDSYRDKNAPLSGKAGLAQLVAEGKLRIATDADFEAFRVEWRKRQNPSGLNVVTGSSARRSGARYEGYVVLAPMQFPASLTGANSTTFIIAKGVPRPSGKEGHSTVLDLNNPVCAGEVCQ
jgi:uncharacterized membrane protein